MRWNSALGVLLASCLLPILGHADETRIKLLPVSASLSDDVPDAPAPRLPKVYQSEREYLAIFPNPPHLTVNAYSAQYGYMPNCQCDEAQYAAGLWAGYCENRRTSWYERWLFAPLGFRGKACGCHDCSKGK